MEIREHNHSFYEIKNYINYFWLLLRRYYYLFFFLYLCYTNLAFIGMPSLMFIYLIMRIEVAKMPFDAVLLGRYRLIRVIGRWAMSEVYLAEDDYINQQVAIKVIVPHPDLNIAKDTEHFFQRELKAIARLDHPHILPLY